MKSLPCNQCKHECCGPVPISKDREKRILALIGEMTADQRKRLSRQKRETLDCGFIDLETSTCSIYSLRPHLCRFFGSTKGMQCPKVTGLVQIVNPETARMVVDMEYESGVAFLSNSFDWSTV
jgi:uncharacterized protein